MFDRTAVPCVEGRERERNQNCQRKSERDQTRQMERERVREREREGEGERKSERGRESNRTRERERTGGNLETTNMERRRYAESCPDFDNLNTHQRRAEPCFTEKVTERY